MGLYYLYKRSPKKWRELQAVAAALEQDIVKPTRSQGTRWVDHRRKALQCLTTNYNAIVLQCQEYASGERRDVPAADAAKMKGYLKLLVAPNFVHHLALYRDIVEVVADLSLTFQRDNLLISAVRSSVAATQIMLKRMQTHPGLNLRQVQAAAGRAREQNEANFNNFQDELRGYIEDVKW